VKKDQILQKLQGHRKELEEFLKKLRNKLENRPLDRESCKLTVLDIQQITKKIKEDYEKSENIKINENASKSDLGTVIIFGMLNSLENSGVKDQFLELQKMSENLIHEISNSFIDEAKIITTLCNLIDKHNQLIFRLEKTLPLSDSESFLNAQFIFDHLNLNEQWIIASLYLIAMDVMINKKREAYNLIQDKEQDAKTNFEQRLNSLIGEMKKCGKDISPITKKLPQGLWKIRTDVLHYGYLPTTDQLQIIINATKLVITELSEL